MGKINIPPRKDLEKFLRESENTQRLIDHSNMVADLALRIADIFIAKGIWVNKEVLEAGAILHDISIGKHHVPEHGMIGHDMILELGLPEPVARLADIHMPWSEDEAKTLNFPPKYCKDHFPSNWEEKIFIAADSIPFLAIYMEVDPWTNEPGKLIEAVLPFFNEDYFLPITGKNVEKDYPFFIRWLRSTQEILENYSRSDFIEFRRELESKYPPDYLKEVAR